MTRQILVVEDNYDLAQVLALNLRDAGHGVHTAADGAKALHLAQEKAYDLIILDLMLPGMDGLEVCRRLRAKDSYVPILMLTSKSAELDRVVGLEMGADDYVTKPFSLSELLARVKAVFRRMDSMAAQAPKEQLTCGSLCIDFSRRAVTVAARPVDLTAKEFDLLAHFARHPGRVYTRAQLLDSVWGHGHEGYEHTVNSHINRLRSKLEEDPAQPQYVRTVWGVGYKFAEPE